MQAGTNTVFEVADGQTLSPVTSTYVAWLTLGKLTTPQGVPIAEFSATAGDSVTFTICVPYGTTPGVAVLSNQTTQ